MGCPCQTEPFRDPGERAGRLWLLGLAALGLACLAVWDPLTRPGPSVCWMRHAVGLPCPLCGLTRAVALVLRGRWAEACAFNPLVLPCLGLLLLLACRWGFEWARGRRLVLVLPVTLRHALLAAASAVLLANWAYLLTFRREDDFARSWVGRLASLLGCADW